MSKKDKRIVRELKKINRSNKRELHFFEKLTLSYFVLMLILSAPVTINALIRIFE